VSKEKYIKYKIKTSDCGKYCAKSCNRFSDEYKLPYGSIQPAHCRLLSFGKELMKTKNIKGQFTWKRTKACMDLEIS
jgi:hypothetical protein